MKIFSLPNLVGHVASILDDMTISTIPNPRPSGISKEQYNKWCREATTKGHFLSAWEGLNPQGRVAETNPARYMHGVIADYDNSGAMSKLQALGSSTGHLPTWVVQSFSPGKCRLVWPFENPVLVTNPDITGEFLKQLDDKIKISHALPGFDKASWKESQYFEMGSNWQQINGATPIPDSMLSECMLNGGMAAKMELADVEIPLDVIAEEVERRWPGRWQGQFMEGAAGPLFWVEPFLNHRNAVIRENGMVCFSDRAPSNFMPWRAILGDKFVEKYETERAARLAEMFYFDGANYWTNTLNGGTWKPLNQNNAQLHLKNARCSPRVPKGSFVSEVEKVLVYIQSNRYVQAAVPMLFRDEVVVPYNGGDYLNISTKKAMAPGDNGNPANFPWIYDFVTNGLDGELNGIPASEYFIGWLRRFWMTSFQGNPQPGQSVILAGEAHTGKTFFSKCVLGVAVGGSITAEDILLQRTKFNRQAAHNALWRCDDAIAEGDYKTKQILANSLKAMAANPTVLYQPKFVDTTELPFLGRVFLTCNTDPESLKILPYLDGTIKDKLMMFRMREGYRPHFFGTNGENEARALSELPFFLRWLMDYQVNPEIIDSNSPRFEIASFHHATLVAEANSEQPESILAELIHMAMINLRGATKKGEALRLTSTELVRAIENAELGRSLQQLGGVRTLGKLLHKVVEQKLSPYLSAPPRIIDGTNRYSFAPWAGEEQTQTT
jgi:hypothetical protein